MSDLLDLAPACAETTRVAGAVRDDQLHLPTPCDGLTVGALLDHLLGLAMAFTPGALPAEATASSPEPSADRLDPAWRELLPLRLAALAEAWHDPEPYGRPLQAGGVTMDGAEAVAVALDEVVLHGWDVAVATGQGYAVDEVSAAVVLGFTQACAAPEAAAMRDAIFGPVVAVPDDAPPFQRALGLAGRDSRWSPPRSAGDGTA